jgi:hypothetical protein
MRVMIVALALLTAGCAALPPEVRIRFPDWMRGQGVSRPADTAATAPAAATPPAAAAPTTAAAPSTAAAAPGFAYPTGSFASVHQAFTAQVAQRFAADQSQASVTSALRGEGFACAPGSSGAQVCERLQPIGQGCEDVFVVTAPSAGGGIGDVRRRCPLGVNGPQGAPLG